MTFFVILREHADVASLVVELDADIENEIPNGLWKVTAGPVKEASTPEGEPALMMSVRARRGDVEARTFLVVPVTPDGLERGGSSLQLLTDADDVISLVIAFRRGPTSTA